ncbi:MAG: rhodanese-like domain-containing protein [Paenibacillaceae bacterium]
MSGSTIFSFLFYGLLLWFIYTRFAPIRGLKNLKAYDFKNQLAQSTNKILVDVREPNEYKGGFIPSALNIPLSQLKSRIGEFSKDKEVYLYCRSGMRSKQAARILHKNGISNLVNLQGGISTWSGKITK